MLLKNGFFTEGWRDIVAPHGFLKNQQPDGWKLSWLDLEEPLYDASEKVTGIPECVHKLEDQLPAHEREGGSGALILGGGTTYKIFNSAAVFGAQLEQRITGVQPGSKAKLTVPILAVLYNDSDAYGCESGAWLNGEGSWANASVMGNRRWYYHEIEVTVPANGTLEVVIRVKNKWVRPRDFFIDGITLEATAATADDSGGDRPTDVIGDIRPLPGATGSTDHEQPTDILTALATASAATQPETKDGVVKISVPEGMQLVTSVSTSPDIIVLSVPEGIEIEVI